MPPTATSAALPKATSVLLPTFSAYNVSLSPTTTIFALKAGTGPPLLLLHGYPQTHLIYHLIAPPLTSQYTVILVDLRGYGISSKPSSANPEDHSLYAKSTMAADCIGVMDALGYANQNFYVCGHDRGGRVAHSLCIKYPDRVKKAIFLDIVPTLAMYTATDQEVATAYWHWFFLPQPSPFPEEAVLASPALFASKQMRLLNTPSTSPSFFNATAYAEYEALFRDPATVHAMCEDYRAGAKEDLEEQRHESQEGRKIQCPLRVLWGKHGLVEKKFNARVEWEKVCESGCWDEGSQAVDGGHYIPEECPDVLKKHILEFFKE